MLVDSEAEVCAISVVYKEEITKKTGQHLAIDRIEQTYFHWAQAHENRETNINTNRNKLPNHTRAVYSSTITERK